MASLKSSKSKMSMEIFGDLVLVFGLLFGAVTFTVVNVNYLPNDDKKIKK